MVSVEITIKVTAGQVDALRAKLDRCREYEREHFTAHDQPQFRDEWRLVNEFARALNEAIHDPLVPA